MSFFLWTFLRFFSVSLVAQIQFYLHLSFRVSWSCLNLWVNYYPAIFANIAFASFFLIFWDSDYLCAIDVIYAFSSEFLFFFFSLSIHLEFLFLLVNVLFLFFVVPICLQKQSIEFLFFKLYFQFHKLYLILFFIDFRMLIKWSISQFLINANHYYFNVCFIQLQYLYCLSVYFYYLLSQCSVIGLCFVSYLECFIK